MHRIAALAPLLALAAAVLAPTAARAQSGLPVFPDAVRTAMVDGRYDDALAALAELKAKSPDQTETWLYLEGVAHREAGDAAQSSAAFEELLARFSDSRWRAKARFQLAELHREGRRFEEAERIWEEEARALLSAERKRELAETYLRFADELSAERDLSRPDAADPDYARAYQLYAKVLDLEAPRDVREEARFGMGACMQAMQRWGEAIRDFEAYLVEFDPRRSAKAADEGPGERLFRVLYRLGACRLASGDPTGARRAFEDLVATIDDARAGRGPWAGHEVADDDAERARLSELQGDAAFAVSQTWPEKDAARTPLAIAALERFLARFEGHPRALEAGARIARLLQDIGRDEDAFRAYGELLERASDQEGEQALELAMRALFERGRIRAGQGSHADAIVIFSEYVRRFPTGPSWADAQRAIVDSEHAIGAEHRAEGEHDEARRAWTRFLEAHPLDARVTRVMLDLGLLYVEEAEARRADQSAESAELEPLFRAAIAQWRKLAGKYPQTSEASEALYRIALLLETELGELEEAIAAYRQCALEPWAARARARLALLLTEELTLVTERVRRTNEPAAVTAHVRNVEGLTVELYRLDLEAYFRKHLTNRDVEQLDLDLIAPDATFEVDVTGYRPHAPIEQTIELPVEGPGVWVVTAIAGELRATTLCVRSDVDVIVKSSRREIFVFAQDMLASAPAAGVRVLAALPGHLGTADAPAVAVATTDVDGVARLVLDELAAANGVRVLALKDGHVASDGLSIAGLGASAGLSPRGYVYTDRPAYRPGQVVHLRAIVRDVVDGAYAFESGAPYNVRVSDSQGRSMHASEIALSDFGTLADTFELDRYAPTGTWTVRCERPGGPTFQGSFRVEEYRLEPIELVFDVERDVVYRGESVPLVVRAAWYYGEPVADAPVRFALPDGRVEDVRTDAKGRAEVELATRDLALEGALSVSATLLEESVSAATTIWLAIRGYEATLETTRGVVLAGEPFDVTLRAREPDGDPAERAMKLSVLRRESRERGRWIERLVETHDLATDAQDGEAHRALTIAKGGHYVLRAEGTDRFGNPVHATLSLLVSGDEDDVKLRLLADDLRLEVGADARVVLHNRAGSGLALVTYEGEGVLDYELVRVERGSNELRFAVDHAHFPNFALSASMMDANRFHTATVEYEVARRLTIALEPSRDAYAPGEEARVSVRVTDQLGRPVEAELSLAVVDAALFERYPDTLADPTAFFGEGTRRAAAMRTTSSCTFRYEGRTTTIAAAVLAESERRRVEQDLRARRDELLDVLISDGATEGANDFFVGHGAPPAAAKAEVPGPSDAIGLGGGAGGKFGGRMGGRVRANAGEDDAARAELLAETAFWRADVRTDADGRAEVRFALPERSTRWRITSRGTTPETVVGAAEASFVTRAELFVELKAPGALTEGDEPRFVARVHNLTGASGTASLRLRLVAGDDKLVVPATFELGPGVTEHVFDAVQPVPLVATYGVELELDARLGGRELSDRVARALPVVPWGLEVSASASGRLTASRTVWLELPAGGSYRGSRLELWVGPGVRRLLVDEALEDGFVPDPGRDATHAQAAGDLVGVSAVLAYLRAGGFDAARSSREYPRLFERAQSLVARLVAAQQQDGGWAWSGRGRTSDPPTSCLALAALGRARAEGVSVPPQVVERGVTFAQNAFRGASQQADELKAMIQWALALHDAADFGALNRLHRLRQSLSPAALAYATLALAELGRVPMAAELAERLESSELVTAVQASGGLRCTWSVVDNTTFHRAPLEMTALALLALQSARPSSPRIPEGVETLLAERPWRPARARGFVLAALGDWYGRVERRDERGTVAIRLDGRELETIELDGDARGLHVEVPADALDDVRARLDFEVRGNAQPFFVATMRGLTTDVARRDAKGLRIVSHEYYAAAPTYRGKELPTGFSVLGSGRYQTWTNTVDHLPVGEATHARVSFWCLSESNDARAEEEYLVLEVPLPAGARVLAGSVTGTFESFEERDGRLVLQIGRHRGTSTVGYTLVGAMPGSFRALPARVQSAYEPDRSADGEPMELVVLDRGAESPDDYRPTPDELFHLGTRLYDVRELAEANEKLLALYDAWKDELDENRLREVATKLLFLAIEREAAPAIVRFFEVLKEKDPELYVPFDDVVAVGAAYRELEEHERALLIFRATVEETFGKDLQVAGALEAQGELAGAIETLGELWLAFPDLPSVVASYLTIADKLLTKAPSAHSDAKLRAAGLDRAALELSAIVVLQRFLTLYPTDPLAPDAGLNLVSAYVTIEEYETASALAERLAARHSAPEHQDAFLYVQAVADWYLARDDSAVALLERIAEAEYVEESGARRPSDNRQLAWYILGQIWHAAQRPERAIEYYERVDEAFPDAREAIAGFREKRITLEEVTVVRPGELVALDLRHKNVESAELLVYEVDLMTLYLRERNLQDVTRVNLAGIAPVLLKHVELGEGRDLFEHERAVELALDQPGAYLVICRGDELHTSGLVLVSPLELDVRADAVSGRVRVQVTDQASGAYVRDVDVKVVGSNGSDFVSGRTDPRGLFVADGVVGTATVIARLGDDRYAFHRGTQVLGQPEKRMPDATFGNDAGRLGEQAYFENVFHLNEQAQQQRLDSYQQEVDRARLGVQVKRVQ